MAPKRLKPLEDPPSASSSSSEEEEVESDEDVEEEPAHDEEQGEEEEEEEDEEEEELVAAKDEPGVSVVASHPAFEVPVSQRESSFSEESGDPSLVKKPKGSKTVGDAMVKKANSKTEVLVHKKDVDGTDAGLMNTKTFHPVDGEKIENEMEEEVVKKRKKSDSDLTDSEEWELGEDSKRQGQRVFSWESEVVLLKCMADFIVKKGEKFMADHEVFYEYVKKKLGVEFSKSQLVTKAKSLKKKYKKNVDKVTNGEKLTPREHKMYELSKKIWGGAEGKSVINGVTDLSSGKLNGQWKRANKGQVVEVVTENMSNPKMDDAESDDFSMLRLVEMLQCKVVSGRVLDEALVREGLRLAGNTRRFEMVEQWNTLLMDEAHLNLRRLELAQEQGQLGFDALRVSPH